MPATLTTIDSILKEVYEGRIDSQMQDETTVATRIERTSAGVVAETGGKYVAFPIRIQRNSGVGMRNEADALPDAGQQGYTRVLIPLHYGYGRLQLTGQAIDLSETSPRSFAAALDDEMDGLKRDVGKDANRQFYMDGKGNLTEITADGANTITVTSIQYLEEGMVIDIANHTSPYTVLASARQITAINTATNVVTYSGADVVAVPGTHAVFRSGNAGKEVSGFDLVTSATAVLHSVDPATVSKWKGTVNANGGVNRALSESLMIKLCDDIRVKGGKVSVIFTPLGVRRSYFNLLTQQRRFTNTKEFTGGFQGLPFNYGNKEIPVVEDVDCPPAQMYFIEEDSLKIYRNKPWHWLDRDGSVLKWVVGYDKYEAALTQYWEIGTSHRCGNGLLDDITES